MDLIGPSLKGQQNGIAWHKSKHEALKNFSHNTSLRKLTTDVKALGVTAPLAGTPLRNLVPSQVVVIGINVITRKSDKFSAFLVGSDEHGTRARENRITALYLILLLKCRHTPSSSQLFSLICFRTKCCTFSLCNHLWLCSFRLHFQNKIQPFGASHKDKLSFLSCPPPLCLHSRAKQIRGSSLSLFKCSQTEEGGGGGGESGNRVRRELSKSYKLHWNSVGARYFLSLLKCKFIFSPSCWLSLSSWGRCC